MNTYDWIHATAISSIINNNRPIIIKNKIKKDTVGHIDPINVNNKWPATIFAAKRIANVPGRIILLTLSINTIRGIKIVGVPIGTKCLKIWLYWKINDQIIQPIHKGNLIDKVITKWLVLVKI